MLTSDFLSAFKRRTQANWSTRDVKPDLYGFQFQRGTRWNPGLSDEELRQYQVAVCAEFPNDVKAFLRAMNGTDLPTVTTPTRLFTRSHFGIIWNANFWTGGLKTQAPDSYWPRNIVAAPFPTGVSSTPASLLS